MTITARRERAEVQTGGDIVITTGRRWVRFAAYYGEPPGSHIGFWRTRAGNFRGWNLRVGRRYRGPCLTLLVHTRPEWEPVDNK